MGVRVVLSTAVLLFFLASAARAADEGIPVGAVITISPSTTSSTGPLRYRYRVRFEGGPFRMVRDFGLDPELNWAAGSREGNYEFEIVSRDLTTGESVTESVAIQIIPRVTGSDPVVSATGHPLVFLYSAPGCPDGSKMRVEFKDGKGVSQSTPYCACRSDSSMNFYLAGMRPNTEYTITHIIDNGSGTETGPALKAATGELDAHFAPYTVTRTAGVSTPGVLLHSTLFEPTVATDLDGNVVWYYTGRLSSLTRPLSGGRFLGFVQALTADEAHQIVREFDVAGNTIQETNAERVNEQLRALGKRQITGFHHEARRLPDGKLMVLASVEQIFTDVQGPGPVDVLGDMIIVMDENLQVVWTWDAFDHLDVQRAAILGEPCFANAGGCPRFVLAEQANDWLHGNSLHLTPDGNILYSARHQDWVIKIHYDNGAGSGMVLWRLGKDGDFRMLSNDPQPWFSHQHDPNFEARDPARLDVFDNGNTRYDADQSIHSRGQVLRIDESNRTAQLVVNSDLGVYSYALGSAQRLPNGGYHFLAGWLPAANISSRSFEVTEQGAVVYTMEAATPEYRTFRMKSLYEP